MGSCPRVLDVSFSYFPTPSLVLDCRGRLEGLGGKAGVLVTKLSVVYCANVSESSGDGSPELPPPSPHKGPTN